MNSNILLYPVFLPIVVGVACLLISKKGIKEVLSVGISLVTFILSVGIFLGGEIAFTRSWLPTLGIDFSLRSYHFSSFILLFITLFGVLISLYSVRFMAGKPRLREYYAYLLWTIGASSGAALSDNFLVFLLFWGALALLLYGFLSLGSYQIATKGLFIIGAADFALILGVLLLYRVSGTLQMSEIGKIPLLSPLAIFAFVLLMIGAIAKAGALPFHTWIPDAAESAPLPVMAFLPASLDKLLGIYFLSRICLDFFRLTPNSGLSILLMFIGSFTIIAAVMMALVQHNLKKLLSYHAISQVGYMVLGVGTGIPVGMAGGIFHMLNHAIYKCCLFLGGGAVEHRMGTTDLSRLGGLARAMPVSFITFLIAALSISGVPPFNGFFSKWMVYQGVIELGKEGVRGNLWIVWLLAAMFGSALTLASFMKLIHATFLGKEAHQEKATVAKGASRARIRDPGVSMSIPLVVLGSLCVIFGISAYGVPLKFFILGSVPEMPIITQWLGWWQPGLATVLIILGIVIGGALYSLSKARLFREDAPYIGGEPVSPDMKVSGVEFYDTIKDFTGLSSAYGAAEKRKLDFYEWGMAFSRGASYLFWAVDRLVNSIWSTLAGFVVLLARAGSLLHTGILHSYLAWYLLGIIVLLLVFFR
ncbi:MAG: NADH-quinone oxidoreductase subunit L [Candidatus Aerophobus sp.]|nr:MAG: NADH-quinone oxidoreductase subunit L [Candidatus Aerophobus sp.]